MDTEILKYIIICVGFLSLFLERTIRTKKAKEASVNSYTGGGLVVLLLIPFISFIIVLIMSIHDDNIAKTQKAIAMQKQKDDSVMLLRRWQFDTIRFKQILDSSEKIIQNGNANLLKAQSSLSAASVLLANQQQQFRISNENLGSTKGLYYLIPDTVEFRFVVEFNLNYSLNSLTQYLDSLIKKDNIQWSFSYMTPVYKVNLSHCIDSSLNRIKSFCQDLTNLEVDFSKDRNSIFMLFNNNWNEFSSDYIGQRIAAEIKQKRKNVQANLEFEYLKEKNCLIVKMKRYDFLPLHTNPPFTDKSLYDLDKSTLSIVMHKGIIDPKLIKLKYFALKLKEKDVLLFSNLVSSKPEKIPKNYSRVKNHFDFFQTSVGIFWSRRDIRMLYDYERDLR